MTPIYFTHGELVAERGVAKVYYFNDQLHLEIGPGHNLWAYEGERDQYVQQIIEPFGHCLEIGLGLGTASQYILSFDEVKSLTTVEIHPDVIEVHKIVNPIMDERHSIVHMDGLDYMSRAGRRFHYVFLDFYDIIDEDTIFILEQFVKASKKILYEGGKIQAWLDTSTPREFAEEFYRIMEEKNDSKLDKFSTSR